MLRLALFGGGAVLAVAVGFLLVPVPRAGNLVQRFGFFTMAGTVLWWVWSLRRLAAPAGAELASWPPGERRRVGMLILALSVVAVLVFPYSSKILYDELVLQSTAWSMHRFREVAVAVRGYEIEGVFTSLDAYLDKRPFFFAFLVALLHDLTGYREANAFLLNTALLPVVLGLCYAAARRLGGREVAWAGLLCFGASPLLAQNANGAGMEMLNLAMILFVLLLAITYLAHPEEQRLSAFILSCVLLAQTRYESALFVLPTAVIVLEGWRRAGRIILPAAALLAPILLVPSALHHTFLAGTPLLWELPENMDARFGWEHVARNLQHAGNYLFSFSRTLLNSWWLALAGLPAFAWAVARIFRYWRQWPSASPAKIVTTIFGLTVTANLGLLMFYFWGQLDDPIVARLVLPFNVMLAFAIVAALARLPEGWRPRAARLAGGVAVISYFGWGLPAAAHHRGINQLETEAAWELREVERMAPVPRLIVTNKTTLHWMLRSIPAIQIVRARLVPESVKFHLEQGTFREILVMQLFRPTGPEGRFQVDPSDRLPDVYRLEPVVERHIGARIARISRIVEVRAQPVETASEDHPPSPRIAALTTGSGAFRANDTSSSLSRNTRIE